MMKVNAVRWDNLPVQLAVCLWLAGMVLFGIWLPVAGHQLPAENRRRSSRPTKPTVVLAAEVLAMQEFLTLADVAEISASDFSIRAKLGHISLGYAPAVGLVRELELDKIKLALAAAGFTPETIKVTGPKTVLVRRAGQVIDPELLRQAIEQAALSDLRSPGVVARLVRADLPSLVEAPTGDTFIRATAGTLHDLDSPFVTSVEIVVNGRVMRRFQVMTQVEAVAQVLVAKVNLAAGRRPAPAEVELAPYRLVQPLSAYFQDFPSLRGQALRKSLAGGTALTRDCLFPEFVVKAGDEVRIIGQSGALLVETKGEARAAGRVGERIQVKNLQSGAMLQAVVVDEGVVRIAF